MGPFVSAGLIPFETAGRKLDDVTSGHGSEQVPGKNVTDTKMPCHE